MPTGFVLAKGTPGGSTGTMGHGPDQAIDGNPATYFSDTSGYLSIDLGSALVVQRFRFQPRRGDASLSTYDDFENRTVGSKIQHSPDGTTWTDFYTFDSTFYHNGVWNDLTLVSVPAKRYWRWLVDMAAEVQWVVAANTDAKPFAPVITPWGGGYESGTRLVTMSCETTDASIYYTTDGSTPDNTKTLYTGPFTLTIGGSGTTVKAIAYHAALATPYSDVPSIAEFFPWQYKPLENWRDQYGDLIEAHTGTFLRGPGGGLLAVNDWYYHPGSNANRYNVNETYDSFGSDGVWLYKYRDMRNPTRVKRILPNAPGQTNTVRPSMLYCPSTDRYVLWAEQYTASPLSISTCVAMSDTNDIEGNWTWQSWGVSNPTGFFLGGAADQSLFQRLSGEAYFVFRQTSVGLCLAQLADDFLSCGVLTVIVDDIDRCEAPHMFEEADGSFLILASEQHYYAPYPGFNIFAYRAADVFSAYSARTQIGTDTGQPCGGATFSGGHLLATDAYGADHYDSRFAFYPIVAGVLSQPTHWNLSELGFVPASQGAGRFSSVFAGPVR